MSKPEYMNIPPWDGKTEVSVIIPFCNEGQNIVFTAQSVNEELDGFCKYEIILIDNQSDWHIDCSVKNERMPLMNGKERPYPIRSRAFFQAPPGSKRDGSIISTMFFRKGIMKYLQYDVKQGHWNAKNHGIRNSKGKYLFFLDAHCIMNRDGLRHMIQTAVSLGVPCLAMSASLGYYDAYRSERLPANLTQAQRDYFGAHTYRRTDREGSFHTEWERRGAPEKEVN